MPHRRLLLAVVVLVATAGCGGSGGAGTEPGNLQAGDAPDDLGTTTPAEAAATRPAPGNVAPQVRSRRALIFTGQVEIEVGDFDAARRNLTRVVREYGGYVSDASERVHRVGDTNATYTTGRLTLRVPRSNFSAMMERAKSMGTLLRSSRETQDVTDQLVDLRARLRNLRAQRERLRELYENASDTEAILQVEERLSEVQTEIERLEARQKELQNRVAMSTIDVELREPRPDPETASESTERWYETGVLKAFLDSVGGVVVVARALVVAFAYALPYLLVFGAPLAGVGYAIWRRRTGEREG